MLKKIKSTIVFLVKWFFHFTISAAVFLLAFMSIVSLFKGAIFMALGFALAFFLAYGFYNSLNYVQENFSSEDAI